MTIKRCYPVLVGASVAENQLCNGESVTVPNGHKFYLKKSGTESLGASTGTAITGLTSGTDMVIDLTRLLGSAIADYVYSLEQATAGSGIAWLRSYGFLGGYIPYNAGSIESVEATAKVVRDENGENAVTYPLGSDVLRGLFKLDANNNLYADGDRKEADGTITRRYGSRDLGSLNWTKTTATNIDVGYLFQTGISLSVSGSLNCILDNYVFLDKIGLSANVAAYGSGLDKVAFRSSNRNIYIIDSSYNDGGSFKTAMNGHMLVYELETPTTEQSTPFTYPQVCYPDGTEEFVTENGVPVGHETKYQL